jgi:hypothetical protein
MAPIYSTKIIDSSYPNPFSAVVYTVPAGQTLVVTDIDTAIRNTLAGQLSYITLGVTLFLMHTSPGAELINQQWVGKQVLDAGDTIAVNTVAASYYARITGYLLR